MNRFFIQFKATREDRGGLYLGGGILVSSKLDKILLYYYLLLLFIIIYYNVLQCIIIWNHVSLGANYSVLDQDIPVNLKSIQ